MDDSGQCGTARYYFPAIELNRDSPVPLHHQLARQIRGDLEKRRIPGGALLPQILTLAGKLNLNRETARQAYATLEREDVLTRLPGGRKIAVSPRFEENYRKCHLPALGIVLPDKMADLLAQGSLTALEVVAGIMDTAAELGVAAMPVPLPEAAADFERLNGWLEGMLDKLNGLIYLGESAGKDHGKAFELLLSKMELPQVFIGGRAFRGHLGTVTVDLETGMLAAVEHLRENGHREVALLGYDVPERKIFQLQTFERLPTLAGIARNSFAVPEARIQRVGYDLADLRHKLAALLSAASPPTALLCCGDTIAAAALDCLCGMGKGPADLAVIGFDDSRLAAEANLTSIRQPYRLTGKAAVEMIVESRRTNTPVNALGRRLATSLVIRQSSALKRIIAGG